MKNKITMGICFLLIIIGMMSGCTVTSLEHIDTAIIVPSEIYHINDKYSFELIGQDAGIDAVGGRASRVAIQIYKDNLNFTRVFFTYMDDEYNLEGRFRIDFKKCAGSAVKFEIYEYVE